MGVGQRFLTKIVIFMPIGQFCPLKLGYSGPKQINKSGKWLSIKLGLE